MTVHDWLATPDLFADDPALARIAAELRMNKWLPSRFSCYGDCRRSLARLPRADAIYYAKEVWAAYVRRKV